MHRVQPRAAVRENCGGGTTAAKQHNRTTRGHGTPWFLTSTCRCAMHPQGAATAFYPASIAISLGVSSPSIGAPGDGESEGTARCSLEFPRCMTIRVPSSKHSRLSHALVFQASSRRFEWKLASASATAPMGENPASKKTACFQIFLRTEQAPTNPTGPNLARLCTLQIAQMHESSTRKRLSLLRIHPNRPPSLDAGAPDGSTTRRTFLGTIEMPLPVAFWP